MDNMFTIQSVHGLKQTVVLSPRSNVNSTQPVPVQANKVDESERKRRDDSGDRN